MNLLPGNPERTGSGASRSRVGGRFRIVWGVLVFGLTLVAIGLEVRSLNARLESAKTERDRLAVLSAEREGLQDRLRADRKRLRQLRIAEGRLARWEEERSLIPELLRALSGAIPNAVVLEIVHLEGPDLRVTGRAGSAALVAKTLESLAESERLRGLELLWVEQANQAEDSAQQRFAFAGLLRYQSREPEPFERIELLSRTGKASW